MRRFWNVIQLQVFKLRLWTRFREMLQEDINFVDLPIWSRERAAWAYTSALIDRFRDCMIAGMPHSEAWPEAVQAATRAKYRSAGLYRECSNRLDHCPHSLFSEFSQQRPL